MKSREVDSKVKLNLMKDRSCISILLKVKDSNLKFIEWAFSDDDEWIKWVVALQVALKTRLKSEE